MSDYYVAEDYPADAIGGADFLTGAARRLLVDTDARGEQSRRPERVVITQRMFDLDAPYLLEGRVCIGEQTIRTLGAEIGLVDPNAAARLELEGYQLRHRNDQLEAENAALKLALDTLPPLRTVYVSIDGTHWGTDAGARDHAVGLVHDGVERAHPLPEVTV